MLWKVPPPAVVRAFSYQNGPSMPSGKLWKTNAKLCARNAMSSTKKWKDCSINEIEQQEFDRLRAILNEIDADPVHPIFGDPVYSDFRGEMCFGLLVNIPTGPPQAHAAVSARFCIRLHELAQQRSALIGTTVRLFGFDGQRELEQPPYCLRGEGL